MTAPGPRMTVPQARERYRTDRPAQWHSQPVCQCGCYAAQHGANAPHSCLVCRWRSQPCRRYLFAAMGEGDVA